MTRYCSEDNVYEATGLNSTVVKNLSSKNDAEVTTLIESYIDKADKRIKRLLKVPIKVRKEQHRFQKNKIVELGSYEDEFDFFSANENVEGCVETIYALYQGEGDSERRLKLPYPKDCDEKTEDVTDMTATNCTLTKETTDYKCGTASAKVVFQVDGKFYFPTNANLNKNIEPWDFIGFWFKTSDKTATFTIRLYDKDGNYNSHTFTCDFNNTWEIIALTLSSFSGSVSWGYDTKLQKIEIISDTVCTCYFDCFNFNDGIFWTYPEGLLCWSDPDSEPYLDVSVTYAYDPYSTSIPDDVEEASALLAGVKLLDYCIGARQRMMGFRMKANDLDNMPDRETLEVTRVRLKREAMQALNGIGFGTIEN